MTIRLRIKHASKSYDVAVEPQQNGLDLKEQLAALTGIPVARQKVLVKGRQLEDSVELSSTKLKSGQTLMMLGTMPHPGSETTATAASAAPGGADEGSDDSDDEFRQPLGIQNVGNTCYLNATLEALHMIPELNSALANYKGPNPLLVQWARLNGEFGHSATLDTDAIAPHMFLTHLRSRFPQFGEMSPEGIPKQQDAEELWTHLVTELQSNSDTQDVASVFDGKFLTVSERDMDTEGGDGTPTAPVLEDFTKLMCHINVETNFLKEGLRASLIDEIDLGNNGTMKATKRIAKLPKYLTVQFVRFFWRRDTGKNSKILRKVSFPLNLDVADLCTDDLQARMAPSREAYRALEGAIEEQKRAARRARFQKLDAVPQEPADTGAGPNAAAAAANDEAMQDVVSSGAVAGNDVAQRQAAADAEARAELTEKQRIEDLKVAFRNSIDPNLAADPSGSPHGLYELQAIVTHQGMSADSGHYQCFTRNPDKPTSWWRFNDDRVSEVDDNRIAQLAGGGASDSALILLYKSADV